MTDISNSVVTQFIVYLTTLSVTQGHAVVQSDEALRYKPEGRGFDSMEFFIDIILSAALWP